MYDVKTYHDGVEKETVRGLSLSQVVALESCLQRHGVKHSVKEYAAQHGAQRTGDEPCVNCGQPYSEHKGRGKFCKNRPTVYTSH